MPIIGTLPNNIQDGQIIDAVPVMADFNFIVNQVNANAQQNTVPSTGALIAVRQFITSTTYTPTLGTNSIIAEMVGGGGGGGGAPATGASQVSAGGPGGAGGYLRQYAITGFSGVTLTVGTGGAGGTGAAGSNGTASALALNGGTVQANGGFGGTLAGPGTLALGPPGAGGITTPGNIVSSTGAQAGFSSLASQTLGLLAAAGGPPSVLGPSFGAGGAGSAAGGSSGGATGGAGAQGVVIIYEYA